jgi:hypothetical protein
LTDLELIRIHHSNLINIISFFSILTINFGSATRADHSQMTSIIIADTVKNWLIENLEMIVKEARDLVKQNFPTVQPSYNKLWRGRELTIVDLFGN